MDICCFKVICIQTGFQHALEIKQAHGLHDIHQTTSCISFDPVSIPSSKVIVRKNEVLNHLIAVQHHQTFL
jgi:hypothetical protein